jgi:cbb3-type cytochrome oxidase maturation protein
MVAIGFLLSFIWSIRAGQYEDDYTPSVRILFDDEVNVMPDDELLKEKTKSPSNNKEVNNKPKT